MAVYPPQGYTQYTVGQIRGIITHYSDVYGVPQALAHAIAWYESTFNPNAAGDVQGGHPTSFGLYQLHDAAGSPGLGTGLSLSEKLDPRINADRALAHLAQTPHGADPSSWGTWAADSQRPGDPIGYAATINQLLVSQPWQTVDQATITNPGPAGVPVYPTPPELPTVPGGPPNPPGPADPGTTGSGLPDLVTADPVVIGHLPVLGDITLNMTPLLNWGIRIGLTLVGGGFVVGGLFVLARPSMEYVQKGVQTVAEVAAVAE